MTSRIRLTFEMELECFDARRLHAAALEKLREDGIDGHDAESTIGTAQSPNVEACAVMMLDPGSADQFGCSVIASSASAT